MQGDFFNAYTNTKPDFVVNDDSRYPDSLDQDYFVDNPTPRNNMDIKPLNNSGKLLLNLCKETSLKILNGRKIGDTFGKYTCRTYNGCSVVDYTLISTSSFQNVGKF